MRLCIDTNAYTALMKGEKDILRLLENADEINVPATVLGELFAGFQSGSLLDRNLLELENFLSKHDVAILETTRDVSFRYGYIFKILKEQGTPIPSNDIWIAAASMDSGSILLSRDRYFSSIPGLQVLDF